ncbi:MAG: oligosaccharide flippase family protein [Dehalococcoidia bacterium]|nr:oligosaccharide flippase family protein [Dehalococcoidia bacterium]
MKRHLFRLSKNSIVYGLSTMSVPLVNFFLIPLYTSWLSVEDYGVLSIFTTTQLIVIFIAYMGIVPHALLRFFFQYKEKGEQEEVISTALISLGIVTLVMCLTLGALSGVLSSVFFHSHQYASGFLIVFLAIFFDAGVTVAMVVFRAKEEPGKYVAFSLFQLGLSVALKVTFLTVLKKGVIGIVLADLISLAVLYILLVGRLAITTKLRFSMKKLNEMLRFGLPMVPSSLADFVLISSDRYFLQFMSHYPAVGTDAVGLYSLGYSFGRIAQAVIMTPFNLAWMPFMLGVSEEKNAKQIYSSTLTYLVFAGVFVVLGLSVLSEDVIHIMARDSEYYDAYKVVPLLALSYLFLGCSYALQVGIYLEKKTTTIPLMVGSAAVVNIALNFILIPRYGMMGAAITTAVSMLVLPIASYFVSRRYCSIQYDFLRIAKPFLAAVPLYVASLYITNESAILEGMLRATTLLGYPVLLFALRFYTREDLRSAWSMAGSVLTAARERLARIGRAGGGRKP